MAGAFIEVHASGLNTITQTLQQLIDKGQSLDDPLAEIGEMLLLSHRERWDNQQDPGGFPWAELSPFTIARKLEEGRPTDILRESDTLRDTLNYQVQNDQLMLGSPMEYAATHQFGREGGGWGGSDIPARPFLGMSAEDKIEVLAILQDYLLEAL